MRFDILLKHEFVEFVPDVLEEQVIYVCIPLATVAHKCVCGCGSEIVTPLTPTDWELMFNGETVSLNPSIGNWSYPCQSHYWIRHNRATSAFPWSANKIAQGRARDRNAKDKYYGEGGQPGHASGAEDTDKSS